MRGLGLKLFQAFRDVNCLEGKNIASLASSVFGNFVVGSKLE